ncbi:hypothetical protein [Arcticibacterium luteifluviistationis]|uniref:Outer membrane protein beta-barrel domain-containing protein n=1 Tax=Arcticibacterium luteifluviistationis TaxID=1784714 RepID=A0A2Z4GG22_9BACT|nr:hypothetical protein [Arcticibacterium luteifluviistationis]AWV99934.1 hypothetical protein DJ013_17855 [Arcticibacterium luteifluviistationis]
MLKSLITLFVFLLGFQAFSQEMPQPEEDKPIYFEQPKSNFKENLHYGGNVWLGFFGSLYADLSPMAGYELNESGTVAGLGATFIYQGRYDANGKGVAMVGPRIFIRQPIWRSFFAHAEYEIMNAPISQFYSFDRDQTITGDIPRAWEGSPLVGLGMYQGGNRQQAGSFISIMYNVGHSYGKGFVSPQGLGGSDSPLVLRLGFFF